MNEPSNVLRGILHPDGTLELAERPTLPAGDVEVTIRPVAKVVNGENWLECLQRIRAEREAAGYPFRTKEEIDAEIAENRDWGEDRLDEIHRQAEASRSTESTAPNGAGGRAAGETLREFMQRTRAELEASGHRFRTKEEIDADIEEMRGWGEERIEGSTTPLEGYGPYLARIRTRREADGFPFRTKAEIDAEVEELRSWDEETEEREHREAEG
jgi:hypothetical protein